MSYISFDKFGRSELNYNVSGKDRNYNVSGKDRLQDKTMTEIKSSLMTITEQGQLLHNKIKFIQKNLNDFKKEMNFNEVKELREAIISLMESAEASLKTFDMSSNNLQLEYNNHGRFLIKPTIRIR